MSKARLIATEKMMQNLTPEEQNQAFRDPDISISVTPFGSPEGKERLYVKDAVDWKGDATKMPAGARDGLAAAVGISRACEGVTGTTVDPRTNNELPAKDLCQRAVPYTKKERKYSRRPGTVPIEELATAQTFVRPTGY